LCEIPEDAPGVPVRMPVHLRDVVGAVTCLTGLLNRLNKSALPSCRQLFASDTDVTLVT
jgi:hypothetical protein